MKLSNYSLNTSFALQKLRFSKAAFFITSFLLLTIPSFASWLPPSQTNCNINKIKMLNSVTGFAIGSDGYIVKTTDGGSTWKGLSSPKAQSYFIDMAFLTTTTGYVVGTYNSVLKTIDGGNTWLDIVVNTNGFNFKSIYFITEDIGFIGDEKGNMYKTTNGGYTWTTLSSGISTEINGIYFIDANNGWISSKNGVVKKTTDGGTNWNTQTTNMTNDITSMYFLSSSTGWITTNSQVLKTTDGGSNWSIINSTLSSINEISFTDDNTGWVACSDMSNTILKTTNGGGTWTSQFGGANKHLYSIQFVTSSLGFAVGLESAILKTTNGGTNWTMVNNKIAADNLYGSSFNASTPDGWMVGNSGIVIKTSDAGNTWTSQNSGLTSLLTSVSSISGTTAWFAGTGGIIKKTTDGGSTWIAQTSGVTNLLYDIKFFDANNGLCVGDQGKILRTTNGGSTWTSITSGTTNSLRHISYASSTVVYIVGHGGVILKSTNGGSNWTALSSGTTNNLIGVQFLSTTEGYISGAGGTILKTTNGGTNWTAQTTNTTRYFIKVLFTTSTKGWAVGQDGLVARTRDGGNNWFIENPFTYQIVNTISLANSGELLFGAQAGVMSKFKEACPPAAPLSYNTTANLSVCKNGKTTLMAAGEGKIGWYNAATGGTYLGGGQFFTTSNLSSSTTFYAQDSTCQASNSRTAITVSINEPTITSSTPGQRCGNGMVTLAASSSVGTVNWYTSGTGGSSLFTGNVFTTPTLSNTTTYYAEATIGNCISPSRTVVTATINIIPAISSTTPGSRCGTGTVPLSATATIGNVNWYFSETAESPIHTGNTFTTPSLTTTTIYYVGAENNGCYIAKTGVEAKIISLPDATTSLSGTTVTANLSDGSYQWINCNGNTLISGETSRSFTPKTTGNYAVIVTLNNCSDTSNCVNIIVGGINKINENVFSIFPNPSDGNFTIKSFRNGTFTLINSIGQFVKSIDFNASNNFTVTTENLSTGIYFIVGNTDNKIISQKLIVIK